MKLKNKKFIITSLTIIALLAITVIQIGKNSGNQEETILTSSQGLSNKKIGWGIKRNDNHEQPDLGKVNKEILEKNNGIAMGNNNDKYIYLTFDEGYEAGHTTQILSTLKENNVKATFFMTGGWVDSYPDMVKEICSRGHDLGNHSHNHKQMSKLSASEQKDEIMYVTDKVKELTGYDVFLFRPPYGDYNSTLINTVYGCNHYPIQWDVDSLDWRDYGVENIIKTVTNHKALGNGSIILMHNGAKYTAKALGTVIETLQSQGYTFIPISEMIIRDNFHMDGTGRQIAD